MLMLNAINTLDFTCVLLVGDPSIYTYLHVSVSEVSTILILVGQAYAHTYVCCLSLLSLLPLAKFERLLSLQDFLNGWHIVL